LCFLHLAFDEFGLLELCRLTLFNFRVKVLKIKRKLNSPPLRSSILTDGDVSSCFLVRGRDNNRPPGAGWFIQAVPSVSWPTVLVSFFLFLVCLEDY
jgi:hypothetical protein